MAWADHGEARQSGAGLIQEAHPGRIIAKKSARLSYYYSSLQVPGSGIVVDFRNQTVILQAFRDKCSLWVYLCRNGAAEETTKHADTYSSCMALIVTSILIKWTPEVSLSS